MNGRVWKTMERGWVGDGQTGRDTGQSKRQKYENKNKETPGLGSRNRKSFHALCRLLVFKHFLIFFL